MDLRYLFAQYDFNLEYAHKLVADLSNEQMTSVPGIGFENHPAFTLGHLVSGGEMVINGLGGQYEMIHGWRDLFERKGPGDPTIPDNDYTKYPSKLELLRELSNVHRLVKELLEKTPIEVLETRVEWRFDRFMPTELDSIIFMCITHESIHLGQLGAWRRAMELPSALAAIR